MRESAPTARPIARPDVALRRVGSEWVLYDPARGRAHVLNQSAAAVWAYCDGSRDPSEIAKAIAVEVPSTDQEAIGRDVEDVVRRFAAEGLLR